MKQLIIIMLLCGLVFSCATSEGSLFETVVAVESSEDDDKGTTPPARPTKTGEEEEEPQSEPEEAEEEDEEEVGIRIITNPEGALVFLNNVLVGQSPILIVPNSGSNKITVRKDGYYSESIWTTYTEDTLVVMEIGLEEITGYLFVDVEPKEADITLNGYGISRGVTELQIGQYSLRMRLFGYEEWRDTVRIHEKQTTEVRALLEKAEFRLTDLSTTRPVLNPKNPGSLGTTRFSFQVTNYGKGSFVVLDRDGEPLFSQELPEFTTWGQHLTWNGRDADGRPLPDGEYQAGIEAKGRDTTVPSSILTPITIDSTAVISFRGGVSGISGTLFAPTPEVLPLRSFQLDGGIMGHYDQSLQVGRYPGFITVRAGVGGDTEIDVQGGLFIGPEESPPYTVGVGVKYLLPASGDAFLLGANGKITYVGNTTIDTFVNYTGLSAGVSALLRSGPLSFFLSPDIVISPYTVSYVPGAVQDWSIDLWMYGRAGILMEFGPLSVGLSGAVRTTPFTSGFRIDLPFSAAAEVHWLIPGTQIVLSGYLAGEYAATNNYYVMGGGGIGIIN